MLPWGPVKQRGCPASHLSISWGTQPRDFCSKLSANSRKSLCICSKLCSFSLETEFLRLFEPFETLAWAQLPYPERNWARREVPVLPFTRYQRSERYFLGHNKIGHPFEHKGIAQMLDFFFFCSLTKLKRKLRLDQFKLDYLKVVLQGEVLSKMFCFTKNIKSNCSDT